jgi:hypothetical protein
MQTHFFRVKCDVTAKIHRQPFRYRAYVNNELFAERTWIWDKCYLEESFQIQAGPGVYPIRFETVDELNGCIKVCNHRVVTEPGQILLFDLSGQIIDYQGQPSLEISDASI